MNTQGRIFQNNDGMLSKKEILQREKSKNKRLNRTASYDFLGKNKDFDEEQRKRIEAKKRNLIQKYKLAGELWSKDTNIVLGVIKGERKSSRGSEKARDKLERMFPFVKLDKGIEEEVVRSKGNNQTMGRDNTDKKTDQRNNRKKIKINNKKKKKINGKQIRQTEELEHIRNNIQTDQTILKEPIARENPKDKPKWIMSEDYEDPKLTKMKSRMRLHQKILQQRRGKSPLKGHSNYNHEKKLRELRHVLTTDTNLSLSKKTAQIKVTQKLPNDFQKIQPKTDKIFGSGSFWEDKEEPEIELGYGRRSISSMRRKYDFKSSFRIGFEDNIKNNNGNENENGNESRKRVRGQMNKSEVKRGQRREQKKKVRDSSGNHVYPFQTRKGKDIWLEAKESDIVKRPKSRRKMISHRSIDNLAPNGILLDKGDKSQKIRRARKQVQYKRKDSGIFFAPPENLRMKDKRRLNKKYNKQRDLSPKITEPQRDANILEMRIKKFKKELLKKQGQDIRDMSQFRERSSHQTTSKFDTERFHTEKVNSRKERLRRELLGRESSTSHLNQNDIRKLDANVQEFANNSPYVNSKSFQQITARSSENDSDLASYCKYKSHFSAISQENKKPSLPNSNENSSNYLSNNNQVAKQNTHSKFQSPNNNYNNQREQASGNNVLNEYGRVNRRGIGDNGGSKEEFYSGGRVKRVRYQEKKRIELTPKRKELLREFENSKFK